MIYLIYLLNHILSTSEERQPHFYCEVNVINECSEESDSSTSPVFDDTSNKQPNSSEQVHNEETSINVEFDEQDKPVNPVNKHNSEVSRIETADAIYNLRNVYKKSSMQDSILLFGFSLLTFLSVILAGSIYSGNFVLVKLMASSLTLTILVLIVLYKYHT